MFFYELTFETEFIMSLFRLKAFIYYFLGTDKFMSDHNTFWAKMMYTIFLHLNLNFFLSIVPIFHLFKYFLQIHSALYALLSLQVWAAII